MRSEVRAHRLRHSPGVSTVLTGILYCSFGETSTPLSKDLFGVDVDPCVKPFTLGGRTSGVPDYGGDDTRGTTQLWTHTPGVDSRTDSNRRGLLVSRATGLDREGGRVSVEARAHPQGSLGRERRRTGTQTRRGSGTRPVGPVQDDHSLEPFHCQTHGTTPLVGLLQDPLQKDYLKRN